MDYSLRFLDRGGGSVVVSSQDYLQWRETGIAFQVAEIEGARLRMSLPKRRLRDGREIVPLLEPGSLNI